MEQIVPTEPSSPSDAAAARTLVIDHVPLVRAMARRYAHFGVSFDDLVQEGMLGLLVAAERFEPERGHRFGTYARWWVRWRMQRYLQLNRAIVGIPETRAIRFVRRRLRGTTARLEQSTRRPASDAEIARELGVDESDVALVRAELGPRTAPLSASTERHEGLYEPDRVTPDPEGAAARHELRDEAQVLVESALRQLDDRERFIVAERCLTDAPSSLRELGERLAISAERVRQLEQRAFQKMRRELRSQGRLAEARTCAAHLAS